MTNLCPTCSHPLRPGAKFCGFCGADLSSTLQAEASFLPLQNEKSALTLEDETKERGQSNHKDPWRFASIIAFIIMIILIALALLMRYWVNVLPWVGQLISSLFAK